MSRPVRAPRPTFMSSPVGSPRNRPIPRSARAGVGRAASTIPRTRVAGRSLRIRRPGLFTRTSSETEQREADRGARPEAQRGAYWTYATSENRPYGPRCPRCDGRSRRSGELFGLGYRPLLQDALVEWSPVAREDEGGPGVRMRIAGLAQQSQLGLADRLGAPGAAEQIVIVLAHQLAGRRIVDVPQADDL